MFQLRDGTALQNGGAGIPLAIMAPSHLALSVAMILFLIAPERIDTDQNDYW
jgi:hypothetical protein